MSWCPRFRCWWSPRLKVWMCGFGASGPVECRSSLVQLRVSLWITKSIWMYTMWAKVNPFFNYDGTLTFNGEDEVTFTAPRLHSQGHTGRHIGCCASAECAEVMDYDRFTADSLCGSCTIPVDSLFPGLHRKWPSNLLESIGMRVNMVNPLKGMHPLNADPYTCRCSDSSQTVLLDSSKWIQLTWRYASIFHLVSQQWRWFNSSRYPRTDGYTGKADLYRPKSSVNMISSSDSDLTLALHTTALNSLSLPLWW